MKLQEIFNKVATHLLTQNAKSQTEFLSNTFRDYEGRACAIGCLILNKDYKPSFETVSLTLTKKSWKDYWSKKKNMTSAEKQIIKSIETTIGAKLNEKGFSLLLDLQHIHDQCNVKKWRDELSSCAKRYDLTMP